MRSNYKCDVSTPTRSKGLNPTYDRITISDLLFAFAMFVLFICLLYSFTGNTMYVITATIQSRYEMAYAMCTIHCISILNTEQCTLHNGQ